MKHHNKPKIIAACLAGILAGCATPVAQEQREEVSADPERVAVLQPEYVGLVGKCLEMITYVKAFDRDYTITYICANENRRVTEFVVIPPVSPCVDGTYQRDGNGCWLPEYMWENLQRRYDMATKRNYDRTGSET